MNVKKVAVAVVLAGAFAGAAQAQQVSPWYAGGGIGMSQYDFHGEWNDPSQTSRDDKDTGFKAFVGYRFTPRWGIEVGYAKLGEFVANYTDLNSETEATSWSVAATGTFPIADRLSLIGRLGITRNTADLHETDIPGPGGLSFDKSKTGLLWGLGAQYDFSPRVAVRVDYDNYGKFGNSFDEAQSTGRAEADMFSLNVVVGF